MQHHHKLLAATHGQAPRIWDNPLFAKPRAYSTVLFIARSDATTVDKNYFIYFTSLIRLQISMSMRNDIRVLSFTSDGCRVLCQSSRSAATEGNRIGVKTFPQHRSASVNLRSRAFVTLVVALYCRFRAAAGRWGGNFNANHSLHNTSRGNSDT